MAGSDERARRERALAAEKAERARQAEITRKALRAQRESDAAQARMRQDALLAEGRERSRLRALGDRASQADRQRLADAEAYARRMNEGR